jgi:hypothetical protein
LDKQETTKSPTVSLKELEKNMNVEAIINLLEGAFALADNFGIYIGASVNQFVA